MDNGKMRTAAVIPHDLSRFFAPAKCLFRTDLDAGAASGAALFHIVDFPLPRLRLRCRTPGTAQGTALKKYNGPHSFPIGRG